MQEKNNAPILVVAASLVALITLIALTRFTPLKPNWGSLEMRQTATITVQGQAEMSQPNQVATFSVGMEAIEADKETAVNKVNEAMNTVIEQVKAMGIAAADIKTESSTVYQETEYERAETMIYPPMPPVDGTAQKGNWRANNSVSITLRDVSQAETLASVLNNSGANYVYGPNFGIDQSPQAQDELLTQAVAHARERAMKIAAANGQKIGKMLSMNESGSYPFYRSYAEDAAMSVSAKAMTPPQLEPGSSEIHASVTVTFELLH